jgi:hypothetical protein
LKKKFPLLIRSLRTCECRIAEKSTLLPVICNFVGMALGAFMPASSGTLPTSSQVAPPSAIPHVQIAIMSALDLGASIFGLMGLALVGSGVRATKQLRKKRTFRADFSLLNFL